MFATSRVWHSGPRWSDLTRWLRSGGSGRTASPMMSGPAVQNAGTDGLAAPWQRRGRPPWSRASSPPSQPPAATASSQLSPPDRSRWPAGAEAPAPPPNHRRREPLLCVRATRGNEAVECLSPRESARAACGDILARRSDRPSVPKTVINDKWILFDICLQDSLFSCLQDSLFSTFRKKWQKAHRLTR